MKRIDDNTITLTNDEAVELYELLREFMYRDWDRYTDKFICTDSLEDGMKRLNPAAYEIANQLVTT